MQALYITLHSRREKNAPSLQRDDGFQTSYVSHADELQGALVYATSSTIALHSTSHVDGSRDYGRSTFWGLVLDVCMLAASF
jgi:hypothetical protein